jgi:UDP-N-acetylmuramate--alanine ligase
MQLKQFTYVYFIGIGGIGMSALARYFLLMNKQVHGYDKTPSEVTNTLKDIGATVSFEDHKDLVENGPYNTSNTLVIYTPAVPDTHQQLGFFRSQNFEVLKRSQILGLITKDTFCLAVSGTHGKTTTTSILGHLMKVANVNMTAFLGGITENYNSNLIVNGTEVSVVEADEFDRSFLTLYPDMACVTSMDADHLDIYNAKAALEDSFIDFTKRLPKNGKLFVRNGIALPGITYGISDGSDYEIKNLTIENGAYQFGIQTPSAYIDQLTLNLPGRHNLENALVAFAMAYEYGCDAVSLREGLATYRGVKRRFTYHIKRSDCVYIDDYAHHPEEIKAVHQAVRELYPNKKVMAVFQPHLYSRTKDFADEFAETLALFDALILLDIYPARELPIAGVNSAWLFDKIAMADKQLIGKSELVEALRISDAAVFVSMGAGDIGNEVSSIKQTLSNAH